MPVLTSTWKNKGEILTVVHLYHTNPDIECVEKMWTNTGNNRLGLVRDKCLTGEEVRFVYSIIKFSFVYYKPNLYVNVDLHNCV